MAGLIGRAPLTYPLTGNVYQSLTILDTGSGTYTVPEGVRQIVVTAIGGGGGGGGCASTPAADYAAAGGGGAGGMVIKSIIGPASSYTYSVGAAGAAPAAGANNGGTGGNTTFSGTGVSLTANGGIGGTGSVARNIGNGQGENGGSGGTATGGDVNIPGEGGGKGQGAGTQTRGHGGAGGNTIYGSGGRALVNNGNTGQVQGEDATGIGAGGSGSVQGESNAALAGSAGAPGVIIIEEYYEINSTVDFTSYIASQAEAQAGSNNLKLMTPLRTEEHDLVRPQTQKAWANFQGSGTATILESYNHTSVTDLGVGWFTLTMTNAMATVNYAIQVSGPDTSDNTTKHIYTVGTHVASITSTLYPIDASLSTLAYYDPPFCGTTVNGDLA